MTAVNISSSLAVIGTALDSIVTFAFTTFTNNISVFVLLAALSLAVGLYRWFVVVVSGCGHTFGSRTSRHGKRQASLYVQDSLQSYSESWQGSRDYDLLQAKVNRVDYKI